MTSAFKLQFSQCMIAFKDFASSHRHNNYVTLVLQLCSVREELRSRDKDLGDTRHLLLERTDKMQGLADQQLQIKVRYLDISKFVC